MSKLKVLELFGGIGACSKALENLGIDYEIADYVEIDKYAVKSFNAMHDTNFEPQDITQWNKDIEVDLIMHGSPCQDFSLAGKQAGGDIGSGTRSSLMYETIRIVGKLRPKYVIWENVKNLLSKNHRHNFDAYLQTMESLGYVNYYQVLNAKDYGIPQNRERVFTISIREDQYIKQGSFWFPKKQELKLKLKDMLEDEVDEKYYLSNKQLTYVLDGNDVALKSGRNINDRIVNPQIAKTISCRGAADQRADVTNFVINNYNEEMTVKDVKKVIPFGTYYTWEDNQGNINTQCNRASSKDGISPTIPTIQGLTKIIDDENIEVPTRKIENKICETRYDEGIRTFKNDICGTIRTIEAGGNKAILNYPPLRIRKLIPKECWRLMGFDDASFEKAEKVNSNTQLYKQAGNSIVVNVLMAILNSLLEGYK